MQIKNSFLTANSTLVFARVLVASVCGYFLSMIICLWLKSSVELPSREASQLIDMVFFIVYLLVVLWAFSVNSHRKAILSICLPTAVLWGLWYAFAGVAA